MSQNSLPVLLIPGAFGCMSSEIIPHTGTWQFGFAKHMYTPVINHLTRQGFVLSKNLFILYYDWRKSVAYNVNHYLIPLLNKIKTITHQSTLNILAHGTGGYLARYYIENPPCESHIKNLFLIGTPNAGFATSFSYLSGGELHMSCNCSLDFVHLYLRMHMYKNIPPHAPLPDYLIQTLSSLAEMIPSHAYGDYLFFDADGKQAFVPYQTMTLKNTFLDTLNANYTPSLYDATEVYVIAGEGFNTIEHFEIMPFCCDKSWVDGKVIDCVYTTEGDGTNLVRSVFAMDGHQYMLNSDYERLMLDAEPIYMPIIV